MKRRAWFLLLVAWLAVVLVLGLVGCASAAKMDDAESLAEAPTTVQDVQDSQGSQTIPATRRNKRKNATKDTSSKDTGSKETDAKETDAKDTDAKDTSRTTGNSTLNEDGTYTSKDDVALYLHTFGHLPSNYITKEEAEDAGWKTEGLDLDEACPGKSIGGDRFGNREKRLPTAKGRTWYECDIDYRGGRSRGAKRIVYSSDGLIYYTDDHYQTFEKLY